MRILGVDLRRDAADPATAEHTLVLLDAGHPVKTRHASSMPEVASAVSELCGGEPFVLGVNAPVVVPEPAARTRPVENLIRRRLGYRMPAGGRAALAGEARGMAGESLLAGLAASGNPCLPYPDRDRRRAGLAETHAGLILKILLWDASPLGGSHEPAPREELFRAYAAPAYRLERLRARDGWADQAAGLDLVLRALGEPHGLDLEPVREALGRSSSTTEAERAGALLDALLIAWTAGRYLEAPEGCLFLGDFETGYVILPASPFVRRLALRGTAEAPDRLFPQATLRERLGDHAALRPADLLGVPGRPLRTRAEFKTPPRYEFDNVDEMLWWKHTRHVSGPMLPTEGLSELLVALGDDPPAEASPLSLRRSRHRTLSFRFEPPPAWRARVPTRDGRTYPFRILSAVYETLQPDD